MSSMSSSSSYTEGSTLVEGVLDELWERDDKACEEEETPKRLEERSEPLFDETDETEVLRCSCVRNVLRVGDAAYEKEVRSECPECTESPSLTGPRARWYCAWNTGVEGGLGGPIRRCSRHSRPSRRTSTLSGVVAGSLRALRFLIRRTADCSRLLNASTSPRSSESSDAIASCMSLLETRVWSAEGGKCIERVGEKAAEEAGDWGDCRMFG